MASVDMTDIGENVWIDPIPGDDPYATIRKIRAEIYEETKHMTGAEYLEHLRQASERMQQKREKYWAEQAKLAEANT
jgi:hypothetical protein